MDNLQNAPLQEEKKKRETQINTQINAEPQQLNAEPQLMQQQLSAQQQIQSPVLMNAQKQLPVVIPDTAAKLDAAYAEARGGQRMSGKERERRVNIYEQKKALSESAASKLRELDQKKQAAFLSAGAWTNPDAQLHRYLSDYLDTSGTEEALQKNRARIAVFNSGSNAQKYDEFNRIFDEFLALDTNKLKIGKDADFVQNLAEIKTTISKGWQMRTIIGSAKAAGMPIEPERERMLRARAALFEEAGTYTTCLEGIVSSPYYALLRKQDTAGLDSNECLKRVAKASASGNEALAKYYMQIATMHGEMTYGRKSDPQEIYQKEYDRRQAEYEQNAAAYPEQIFRLRSSQLTEGWNSNAFGYDTKPLALKSGSALVGAGVNVAGTRTSIAKFVFVHRTGVRFGTVVTEEQKAQMRAVGADIDNTIENNNTVEAGAALMAEMARGLLATKFNFDTTTPGALAEAAPQLEESMRAYYDYFQILDANKSVGTAVEALLTKEEKVRLMELDIYVQLTYKAFLTLTDMYSSPNYQAYKNGTLEADNSAVKRFQGAQQFFENNRQCFRAISQQDSLHVPAGFKHTADIDIAASCAKDDPDFPMEEDTLETDAKKVSAFYADLKKMREGGNQ